MTSRLTSLGIAVVQTIIYLVFLSWEMAVSSLFVQIFALGCIWWGEDMGSYLGPIGGIGSRVINQQSPGCLVKFCGWILLLLPTIMIAIAKIGMK